MALLKPLERRNIYKCARLRDIYLFTALKRHLSGVQQDSSIPECPEAVIIGGGAVGTSIAYHLSKKGMKNVVLLEQLELTAGSTWHAAGLTTHFHPGVNVKHLHYDSLKLYRQLPQETGQDIGFHQSGTMRVLTTPTRLDEGRYQMARHGWHKAPQRLLTHEEALELHPFLNKDLVYGAIYTPDDGHVDPYSLTQALAIGARQNGAKIAFSKATAVSQNSDGSWTVDTNNGVLKPKRVINAAGFWARDVGAMSGIDLPLASVYHSYMTTGPIPEVEALSKEIPCIRDLECATYVRQERQGLCIGTYERSQLMKIREQWYDSGVDKDFGKELFESDFEMVEENFEEATKLVPLLKTAPIQRLVCGPMCYTPENLPMIGPYQGVKNYWLAVGFGYGIVHAGGVGNYLSDWMINGEPPYSLIELDPNRYGSWANRSFTLSKIRESYDTNSKVIYPREEKPAGRPTSRVTPLYQVLKENRAQFGFLAGWERPNWFAETNDEAAYKPSFRRTNWASAVARETEAARKHVSVVDLSATGKFEISGDDAEIFCDHLYAKKPPQPGTSHTCHMLTPDAKIYAEHLVACLKPGHYFCVTGGQSEKYDLRWMEEVAERLRMNVCIGNVTDGRGCLSVLGPRSDHVMREICEDCVNMNTSDVRNLTMCDNDVIVVRGSLTGESGWEIYPFTKNLVALYNLLMKMGRDESISNLGLYAYDVLRVENGLPAWGSEFKVDYNVVEANLCQSLDLDRETDFIGKGAVLRELKNIPKRQLVLLEVKSQDDVDPEGNETLWKDSRVVGNTTSGCYSYNFSTGLAFGYVDHQYITPGTEFYVDLLGGLHPASVLSEPPFSKTKID